MARTPSLRLFEASAALALLFGIIVGWASAQDLAERSFSVSAHRYAFAPTVIVFRARALAEPSDTTPWEIVTPPRTTSPALPVSASAVSLARARRTSVSVVARAAAKPGVSATGAKYSSSPRERSA